MSEHKRGRWSKEQKFKIALAAIKGDKTIAQLAEEYHVHPNQISEWKKQLLEHGADIFSPATEKRAGLEAREREELIHTIGHQAVIIDWLKKRLGNEDYRSGLCISSSQIPPKKRPKFPIRSWGFFAALSAA